MKMYEHYDIGDEGLTQAYGNLWQGETFTPVEGHTIKSVKLEMYRHGTPGTITVAIKATDGAGLPTGADLCSGTTDGDTLPDVYSGEKREITLGDGAPLLADTWYSIVAKALSGAADNYVRWLFKRPSTYPRGAHVFSSDGGVTWEEDTTKDMKFEEWGEA